MPGRPEPCVLSCQGRGGEGGVGLGLGGQWEREREDRKAGVYHNHTKAPCARHCPARAVEGIRLREAQELPWSTHPVGGRDGC